MILSCWLNHMKVLKGIFWIPPLKMPLRQLPSRFVSKWKLKPQRKDQWSNQLYWVNRRWIMILIIWVYLTRKHQMRYPMSLYSRVVWLVTDMDPCTKSYTSKRTKSQDLMAKVTGLPMPKQVGLAIHVIKQTRCKDLVNFYYDQAQRFSHGRKSRTSRSIWCRVRTKWYCEWILYPVCLR